MLLFHLSGSWNTLALSIFAPPSLLFTMHAAALWSMRWTVLDRNVLVELTLLVGCVLSSSGIIFAAGNHQNATTLGFTPLIVLTSVAPLAKYLYRFHFDRFCYASTFVSTALLATLLAIFQWGFRALRADMAAAAGVYPVALLCGFTLLVWRSELWQPSRTVLMLLLLSAVTTFALALVVTLCVSASIGGVLLGLWGALLLVAAMSFLWLRFGPKQAGRHSLPTLLLGGGLAILLLSAPFHSRGMLVYTAASLLVACLLIAFGLSEITSGYYIRSELLVPCWRYDARDDEIRLSNASVFATCAGFCTILLWGCATAYTEQMTIGVTASGLVVGLLFMYLNHGLQWDQIDLEALCHDVTPQMVAQAAITASQRLAQRSVHVQMRLEARRESSDKRRPSQRPRRAHGGGTAGGIAAGRLGSLVGWSARASSGRSWLSSLQRHTSMQRRTKVSAIAQQGNVRSPLDRGSAWPSDQQILPDAASETQRSQRLALELNGRLKTLLGWDARCGLPSP